MTQETSSGTETKQSTETAQSTETVVTPEIQKIIDERIAEATKKANSEAATHRHKLKEIEEANKKAEEAKLAEQGKFKELLEQREAELAKLKQSASELEVYKVKMAQIEAEQKTALLAKLPEAQRKKFDSFTVEQLKAVVEALPANVNNSQGSERPPALPDNKQQQPRQPQVPFEGGAGGIIESLTKKLGL